MEGGVQWVSEVGRRCGEAEGPRQRDWGCVPGGGSRHVSQVEREVWAKVRWDPGESQVCQAQGQ